MSLRDVKGIVVADLEKRAFASGYARQNWEHLANGYLILDDDGGLVHLPSGDGQSEECRPRPVADEGLHARTGGLRTTMRDAFAMYDGRSPTVLSEISVRHRERAGFLEALIGLIGDDDRMVSEGATWVLKS